MSETILDVPRRPVRTLIDETKIKIDPSLQTRVHEHPELVIEYASSLEAGDTLPDIDVFREGEWWLVGDGVHRLRAYREKGVLLIPCRCHEGGREAALLCAVQANKNHGRKRTREDARKAIRLFLTELDWYKRSDREVAKACAVDGKTVASVRAELEEAGTIPRPEERIVRRGDQEFTQRGKVASAEIPQIESSPPPQPELFSRPADHNASADLYPDPYHKPSLHSRDKAEINRDAQSVFNPPPRETPEEQRVRELDEDIAAQEKNRQAVGEASQEEIAASVDAHFEQLKEEGIDPLDTKALEGRRQEASGKVSVKVERPEKEGSWQHYNTPPLLIGPARKVGKVKLDPCHNANSLWEAEITIDADQDGLSSLYPWAELAGDDLIVVNPPYNNLVPWVSRCIQEATLGGQVLLIVPNRSWSPWWQDAAKSCALRCEIGQRVHFYRDGQSDRNPIEPTILFYWGKHPGRFAAAFASLGVISRMVPEEVYAQAAESLRAEALDERQLGLLLGVTPEERAPGTCGNCHQPKPICGSADGLMCCVDCLKIFHQDGAAVKGSAVADECRVCEKREEGKVLWCGLCTEHALAYSEWLERNNWIVPEMRLKVWLSVLRNPGTDPTPKEDTASEPRAWLTRQKKALGETIHCEDFDELYAKLYSEASEEERVELESIKEEVRAKKPHRANVKPEQVLAAREERAPKEDIWDISICLLCGQKPLSWAELLQHHNKDHRYESKGERALFEFRGKTYATFAREYNPAQVTTALGIPGGAILFADHLQVHLAMSLGARITHQLEWHPEPPQPKKRGQKTPTAKCFVCDKDDPATTIRAIGTQLICQECFEVKPPHKTLIIEGSLAKGTDQIVRFGCVFTCAKNKYEVTQIEADNLTKDKRLRVKVTGGYTGSRKSYETLAFYLDRLKKAETEKDLDELNDGAGAWLPLNEEEAWAQWGKALNKRLAEIKAPIESPLKQKKTAPKPARKQEAAKPVKKKATKKPAKKARGR